MNSITDNFSHNMFTVINCSYNSRCPMRKCRHSIVKMHCMICSRVKCFFCCLIVRIGMSKGNIYFSFHSFNKLQIIFIIFRSNPNKFHKSVGSFQKLLRNFYITRNNISLILCPFFYFTDKRTFHVDSHKICCFGSCPFFLIFCRNT